MRQRRAREPIGRGSLRKLMRRKSTIAFLMTLPLFIVMLGLVAYPAGFAIWLAMLDRSMTGFVGLANFAYLLGRERFWMVVYQTCLFRRRRRRPEGGLGFVAAHLVHTLPTKGQRKWRGMLWCRG
jgi:multiple sugar transport system permease protein